jgi:ketosteroid isomerase-like protein
LRCLLAILALAASLARGEEPSITLPPDLARILVDYENAWRAKDAAALSRLFAEDGFVLSPGNPMVRGRRAIEKAYREAGGPLFLRAVAYAAEGNIGFIIGGYTHRAGTPDTGKFTLTLRKDGSGRWLIVSDMDNGSGSH